MLDVLFTLHARLTCICCMFPWRRLDALRFRSVTRLPPTTNSQPSSLVTRLKTFKEVAQHLHRAYALKQHLDIGAAGANRDKTASSESETHVRLPFFEKCKRSLHSSHSGMWCGSARCRSRPAVHGAGTLRRLRGVRVRWWWTDFSGCMPHA